jgi:Flp pilus assembly protein TadB|tara:strand:- start:22 stop:243 length:222 start_codon:yes stop_codon:yes gene_type:complete
MPQVSHQKETVERLAKIEERTKSIFQELREIKLQLQMANGRTRTLESKQALIFGAGGVLVIVMPIIVNLLMGI